MPVWQKAHKLAIEVFNITVDLPRSEDYGLTSQIRRSSNGVAGNIAEGFGRKTNKDKSNFYIIARGSAFETIDHLICAYDEQIINSDTCDIIKSDINNFLKILNGYISYLKKAKDSSKS